MACSQGSTGKFVGFSTQDVNQVNNLVTVGSGQGTGGIVTPYRTPKKFRTLDEQLVIRDLINALSIPQGSLPGRPEYGTNIFSYVFEQQTPETRQLAQNEITRVITSDPRVLLNTINAYFSENGLLVEVEFSINQFNNAIQTGFFLNKTTGQVTQV